ncbi:uncharacterized protein METZ01_LOCUS203117, partial [marine metagenome]
WHGRHRRCRLPAEDAGCGVVSGALEVADGSL